MNLFIQKLSNNLKHQNILTLLKISLTAIFL
nr:MAG TPA: hypothetical protein [Crassvirales sp.]